MARERAGKSQGGAAEYLGLSKTSKSAIMQPSDHTLSVLDSAGTWWAIRRERISHIRVVDSSPDGSRPTKMGFQMPARDTP